MSDHPADGAAEMENSSVVGRLLEEISWEGNARKYRDGGRGKENALTAEEFYPLNFLPRAAFLGQIVADAHGADAARRSVIAEVEEATVSFLPGDILVDIGRKRPAYPADRTGAGHRHSPFD